MHPHGFRSPLGRHREIVECQVRQTPQGVTIVVRTTGAFDTAVPAAEIAAELSRLGVPDRRVDVEVVDALPGRRRASSSGSSRCPAGR